MEICKVLGNVWATKKEPALNGQRFLILRRMETPFGAENLYTEGNSLQADALVESKHILVAIDNIGAGFGDLVLVARGGASRVGSSDQIMPVDATIVGIIDSVDLQA